MNHVTPCLPHCRRLILLLWQWVRGMSPLEKQRCLSAVVTLSTQPAYKPNYDALIRKHVRRVQCCSTNMHSCIILLQAAYFSAGIHMNPMFFPWHRAFIYEFEQLLQQVDCRITVPYWRWSLEATSPFTSTIWSDIPTGFGGNGVGSTLCVRSGTGSCESAVQIKTALNPPHFHALLSIYLRSIRTTNRLEDHKCSRLLFNARLGCQRHLRYRS